MRNQTYISQRANVNFVYGRNQNSVRQEVKGLGRISQFVILAVLVVVLAILAISLNAGATTYDYQLNEINERISELEEEKEDLAIERARLTALASVKDSEVAVAMEEGEVSGYATE